ncbi:MAG TPA: PspC domain-containing protein [Acidimicrobiia bacterium]|nr:PspC domain-containing protein [Acidimicrobiia bacterium]
MVAGVENLHSDDMHNDIHTHTTPPRLERPADGRVIAGVAQGLANRLDVPVGAVRAGFVVTALMGGPGVAAYIAGILLMPSHNQAKAPATAWVERVFDGNPA